MDEGVSAAVIRLDEAEAFGFVEEFYGSNSHSVFLPDQAGPDIGPPR
jgi:hypothetical protein